MNERIRALAEQANEAFYQRMGEGAERGTFYFDGFAEKFAELIVRECAGVVFKKVGPKSALDVLEHFGVKE